MKETLKRHKISFAELEIKDNKYSIVEKSIVSKKENQFNNVFKIAYPVGILKIKLDEFYGKLNNYISTVKDEKELKNIEKQLDSFKINESMNNGF